jgi:replicative DNA helicase
MDSRQLPPQNIEAEMSVLGAVLLDNASLRKVSGLIDATDFYREAHRIIFKSMLSLSLTKTPIDLITMTKRLREDDALEEMGGASYLATLVDFVPTAENVAHYCRMVKEVSTRRRIIAHGQELISKAYSVPLDEVVDSAKSELSGIAASMDSFSGVSLSDITTVNQRAERYIKQVKTFDRNRFLTGHPMLDGIIRGVAPGEVLTIIAEPGGFKTAWLQNILQTGAKRTGAYSLFFSLEMPQEKVFEREVQIATGVTGRHVEQIYKECGKEAEHMQAAAYRNGSLGLLVCDKPRLDLDKISRYIDLARNKDGSVNVVGIDYAPELKHLAKEYALPLVVLCQINREGAKFKHDIEITDAKGGGDIEASADIMLGFYSDADENLVCKILKNRNGGKGARLLCDIDRPSFRFIGMSAYEYEKPESKAKPKKASER